MLLRACVHGESLRSGSMGLPAIVASPCALCRDFTDQTEAGCLLGRGAD